MSGNWRDRAATTFQCLKQQAVGSRGMVVSNHPLASAAGAEMLAAGGNAIDAAIATLFTLTVVEPMMVGIIGGGMAHIRLADGSHRFIDGQSTVPLAVRPDTYASKPGSAHDREDLQAHGNEHDRRDSPQQGDLPLRVHGPEADQTDRQGKSHEK